MRLALDFARDADAHAAPKHLGRLVGDAGEHCAAAREHHELDVLERARVGEELSVDAEELPYARRERLHDELAQVGTRNAALLLDLHDLVRQDLRGAAFAHGALEPLGVVEPDAEHHREVAREELRPPGTHVGELHAVFRKDDE